MKNLIKVGILLAALLSLVGCNTTKGAGEDLQTAGHAISKSAKKHGAD